MKVLIADDHGVLRDGIRMILEAQNDITVVGEASNGREAVACAQDLCPDVVVMDIVMPGLNGLEATIKIIEECPGTRVLMLSMHSSSEYIHRALKSGAMGFILKESAGRELVRAIRSVHMGKRYLSQPVADIIAQDFLDHQGVERQNSPLDRLSSREREVLQLVLDGKSSKQIATIIHISPKSVDTYRSRLMEKLGIRNLAGLIKLAIEIGLTPKK